MSIRLRKKFLDDDVFHFGIFGNIKEKIISICFYKFSLIVLWGTPSASDKGG
jgi:hypothetical protein